MISCGVGKVQSAVGHTGEKKGRNARARERGGVPRVHDGVRDAGGEGEIEAVRHKPAQDWVILRYHVLRITVPVLGCVSVYLTVCTCTSTCTERQPQHTNSRYFLFSLSFLLRSFALLPPSRVLLSLALPCPPSTHRSRKASSSSFCRENSSLSRAYPRGRSFATRT